MFGEGVSDTRSVADDERHADWIEHWEEPNWGSLEEVYERAGLSPEELCALNEYRDIAEYYLLRAKRPMVTGIQEHPSLIRELAGFLRFLNSPCVSGAEGGEAPRRSFVKEVFNKGKPVHKHVLTRRTLRLESGELVQSSGIRISARSTAFWDKLAELRVLAFLCANCYRVEFPSPSAEGKQPEFFIRADQAPVGIEVKNLDVDVVLDRIFGGFNDELPPVDNDEFTGPDDREGIVGMINSQYEKAVAKFRSGPAGIIVIFVPQYRASIAEYLDPWANALSTCWREGSNPEVALVVLVMNDTVELVENPGQQAIVTDLRFDLLGWDRLSDLYEACTANGLWPT